MAVINSGMERQPGNPDFFHGGTWTISLSDPPDEDGVRVINVDFSPGSRSKWHFHPGGQVLHVLSGEGVVVNRDGQHIPMREGDTVTIEPGERHWHGASQSSRMLQMSITSRGTTQWTGEEVSEDEYQAAFDAME